MKKNKYDTDYPDEESLHEYPEKKRENPFDVKTKSANDIIFECGRHGLPAMHAIRLLRGNITDERLAEIGIALTDEFSEEMQNYADGVAVGEAEMSAALRQATINSEKDSYKSMSAEDRRKSINQVIAKNFGIGS